MDLAQLVSMKYTPRHTKLSLRTAVLEMREHAAQKRRWYLDGSCHYYSRFRGNWGKLQ